MLRQISPADLPDLMLLCREHAQYEGLPFVESGQADRLRSALFNASPRLFGWVVPSGNDGGLSGYMTATIDYATWSARPFVYLDCLYLRPVARRGGLGRTMMSTLADFARDHGCAEIQWQTPPTNAIGLAFYRALGARELAKARFSLPIHERAEA